ncbi:hypothetical protein SNC15_02870, partial [Escherichia coli]|nr:hypothetical protein [Escherichia coli]
DRNRSHWSTSKTPSYTKSVSWQHHPATNKPVIKVVRQGEGKDLNNESTPMAFENIKQVIDDMATDATMFDVNKK